jgi:glycosyltransferase involved in cell wall biosynthesis
MASRSVFDERYPELKLSPVVGLICAYEEEANLGAVLGAMPAEACGLPVATLVVVDGGRDRTDQVALDAGAITFVLGENLGHGYALRVGYALAMELGAEYVVTLDADGQNDPAEIPVMLQPVVDDEADFVVASRRLGQDTTSDRFRKAGVRFFSWVISLLGPTELTDSSNGYRALRVLMLDDVAHRLTQEQYQTAELLITCLSRGWRITERPTRWLPRASGASKKGTNYLFGLRYGAVVLKTWWRERKGGNTGSVPA